MAMRLAPRAPRTLFALTFLLLAATRGAPAAEDGAALYKEHCSVCHETGAVPRAAPRTTLGKLPDDQIRQTLTQGSMRVQAQSLSSEQTEAVVRFLADGHPASAAATAGQCAPDAHPYSASLRSPHWNGWGSDPTQQRFQSAAQARLTARAH